MSVAFISFPRSGSNFIGTNYGRFLEGDVYHSHEIAEINDFDTVFSIIRNPFDSIASMVTLSLDHSKNIEDNCMAVYLYYLIFYHKIINKKDIIFIKFDDVINNFVQTIKTVGKIVGHEYNGNVTPIYPEPTEDFLSTSKNNSRYESVCEVLKTIDLTKCNELYEIALERCIKI
jgi:hypothetical protein